MLPSCLRRLSVGQHRWWRFSRFEDDPYGAAGRQRIRWPNRWHRGINKLPPDQDAAVDGTPGSLTTADGTFRAQVTRVVTVCLIWAMKVWVATVYVAVRVVDVDLTDEFGFADDIISIAANLGEDGGTLSLSGSTPANLVIAL